MELHRFTNQGEIINDGLNILMMYSMCFSDFCKLIMHLNRRTALAKQSEIVLMPSI